MGLEKRGMARRHAKTGQGKHYFYEMRRAIILPEKQK